MLRVASVARRASGLPRLMCSKALTDRPINTHVFAPRSVTDVINPRARGGSWVSDAARLFTPEEKVEFDSIANKAKCATHPILPTNHALIAA